MPLALRVVASDLADAESIEIAEYVEYLADERSRLEHLADWEDATRDVRACFELSFRRLASPQQQLFALLSLFAGATFSSLSIAAMMGQPLIPIKKQITRLQTLSLVERVSAESDRYALHPLLKIFAQEKLATLTDVDADRYFNRLITFFMDLIFAHQQRGFDKLDWEWENILGIILWLRRQPQDGRYLAVIQALTHIDLGRVGYLDAVGRWRVAVNFLDDCLPLAEFAADKSLRAELLLKQGAFLYRLHDSQADDQLQKSLTIFESLDASELSAIRIAQVCEWLAQVHTMGDPEDSLSWADRGLRAIEAYDSLITAQERGCLHIRQGTIFARRLGDMAPAQELIEKGLSLLPDSPSAARISGLITAGSIRYRLGQREEALSLWQEGLQLADTLEDLHRAQSFRQNISIAASERGEFWISIAEQKNLVEVYHRLGDVRREALILSNLGEDYTLVGDFEQANECLKGALALADQHQVPNVQIRSRVNLAQLALSLGNQLDADRFLDEATVLNRQLAAVELAGEIWRLQASAALVRGAYREALTYIEQALRYDDNDPREKGLVFRVKGEVFALQQQWSEAKQIYADSVNLFSDQDALFEVARTQLLLADCFLHTAEIEEAQAQIAPARDAFKTLELDYWLEKAGAIQDRLSLH